MSAPNPPKASRRLSVMDAKLAGIENQSNAMKAELDRMVAGVSDSAKKANFEAEMTSFQSLFHRYLLEKAKGEKLVWDEVHPPAKDEIIPYSELPKADRPEILDTLAVLKLNGGLGTTMGCVGPKSVIEVRDGMTFLDLSVKQIEALNSEYDTDVPFILMNSFNTDEDTSRIIQKYKNHNIDIQTFNQSKYPRVDKESLLPCPRDAESDKSNWYPPGHGDIFDALHNSGLIDKLIAAGKEHLFISNVDNLGAVVDTNILRYMVDSGSEYLMEVTDKTKADVKGGTLVNVNGHIRLLEVAQVPDAHLEDFKSIKKFKIFNTNNLWVNIKAVKRVVEARELSMEIIVNNKVTDDGRAVIQLETAVGAAIKHFKAAKGINVPRSRFLPVKSCSDLLLIKSDLYDLQEGALVMNPSRLFATTPVVKLGDTFKKVADFQKRFKTIPHILEADHVTINGDVVFGKNVTLRGTVIIVANEGNRIQIPDGSILENKLVSGNLAIIDH